MTVQVISHLASLGQIEFRAHTHTHLHMFTLTCILICAHTHAHILPESYPFTPSNTPSYRPTIGSHTQVTYTLLYTIIVTQMHSRTNFYTNT